MIHQVNSLESKSSGEDARTLAIRRILASRAFSNTQVLKRMLDYLGRKAIEDATCDLKEYTVGIEAFGKPDTYDPQTDSSVRVQAGKLRKQLQEYYRTEGAADPIRVALPKGQFRLVFEPSNLEEAEPRRESASRRPTMLNLLLGALAVCGFGLYFNARVAAPVGWEPEMEELWKPLISSPGPLVVAVGTPMFTKIGNSFLRVPGVNTWEAVRESEAVRAVQTALKGDPLSPAFRYTGLGETWGAFALARLLIPRGRDVSLTSSNSFSWEDIAKSSVIFLGPPKTNLLTGDLPVRQHFDIHDGRVHSLNPAPGEPRSFDDIWTPDLARLELGHALISRLPGLHGQGEILILAGNSTECTRAAVEYVTRPEYVRDFVRWMRKSQGGVPRWYQAVVRAQFRGQTPVSIERVAFQPLQ